MERLIESKTTEAPKRPEEEIANEEEIAESSEIAAGESSAPAESDSNVAAPAAPSEEEFADMERTHSELVQDGELIDSFIAENSTQLTYFGLAELHRVINEGQVALTHVVRRPAACASKL